MMYSQHELVIDLGRRQFRALYAQRERRLLRVKRTVVQEYPDWLDLTDSDVVGQWVREQLQEAGMPLRNATFVFSRERVVLKRLMLPTTERDELPEMTRLTMLRDLPFSAEGAVIDFVPISSTETHTAVLAAAVPQLVLQHTRDVAKAAKLHISRITLRGMGSAALLRAVDAESTVAALVIDVTSEAVEFVLVTDGAIRITRAAEMPVGADHDQVIQVLVTETQRTWMSYRISEDAGKIDAALLLGNGELTDNAAAQIGGILNVTTRVLRAHPQIDPDDAAMTSVWPLAGTLLEGVLGLEKINFAKPRQAPDLKARRRQRIMMAGGGALVGLFGLWTAANMNLASLDNQIDELNGRLDDGMPRFVHYSRDNVRVQHLNQWEHVKPQWLDHLSRVAASEPTDGKIVFDSFDGTLDFRGVQFDKNKQGDARWSAPAAVTITLDGEASNRATADALRDAYVRSDIYSASSSGADAPGGKRLPFGFTYRLRAKAQTQVESISKDDSTESASQNAAHDEGASPTS